MIEGQQPRAASAWMDEVGTYPARKVCASFAEAAIFQYIDEFYDSRRRHSCLEGISPLAFEAKAA